MSLLKIQYVQLISLGGINEYKFDIMSIMKDIRRMKKLLSILSLFFISTSSFGACKWVWVDHDYNLTTAPIQKQVCDSTLDIGTPKPPSVAPIQSPQIKPIESPTIPPIGTTQCRTQSVYENGRWVNKKICT